MNTTLETPVSVIDAIYRRRSVRNYTDQKLGANVIRTLLKAAVQAPTAMHLEPWAFVVVQEREALRRYSDRAKASWIDAGETHRDLHVATDFCIFYNAGTLIVICAKTIGPFVEADCWVAAENLMIAASAMGLGTCCIGAAVPALNTADIRSELHIPSGVTAVAPIIVGVPGAAAPQVTRREPEILFWK